MSVLDLTEEDLTNSLLVWEGSSGVLEIVEVARWVVSRRQHLRLGVNFGVKVLGTKENGHGFVTYPR